ncbi:PACRG-like protein isoform X3 [Octopus bimaculoides]|uniref:PACRG-like protein n=1 Tax=Octopus bimaculoides TaxID=37653 RepID=A0A0L8GXT2_OCTBM|nr:PACRG-like protein isoform X3 [Octopus bimaculoides]|eukprot:XP_014777140.1 PREDICTED: PACRG-like protein isoform X2 [Octopus bimaculoides]
MLPNQMKSQTHRGIPARPKTSVTESNKTANHSKSNVGRVHSAPVCEARSMLRGDNDKPPIQTSTVAKFNKPSARLNPKTIDPFNTSTKNQSVFSTVYINGGIPCCLVHGSVKHKLSWSTPPESVPFDPVLVTLAETHRDDNVFENGLEALSQISATTKDALNIHLKSFLLALAKRRMEKKYRDKVTEVLEDLEQNGGTETLVIIKSKIPTYSSINR